MVLVGIGAGLCFLCGSLWILTLNFFSSRIDDNDTDVSTLSKKMFVTQKIPSEIAPQELATLLLLENNLSLISSFSSLSLRVFADPSHPEKMWKANVKDIDGDVLCVSQFTLLANTNKGNKPDFHRAMVKHLIL